MSPLFKTRPTFEKSSGESLPFVKIKDGESATGVLRGQPLEYWRHWNQAIGHSEACTRDTGACAQCAEGHRASWRFRYNMVVKGEGGLESRVFEGGAMISDQLEELAKDYDLSRYTIKISRKGSGLNDTVWTVMPLPDGKLSDAALAMIAKVPLQKLDADLKPKQEEIDTGSSFGNEDIPF